MRSFDELLKHSKGNSSVYQSLRDMMKESYRMGDFKIVPFIGSGLTAFVYPTWTNALQELASELGNPPEFRREIEQESPDLENAAEVLWNGRENRIGSILRDKVFGLNKLEGQNLRRQVVNILPAMFPNSLLITTNFDKTIETVFSIIGKRIDPVYPEPNRDLLNELSSQNDRCCLFKLHGDIYDNPDRIVFPRSNYERVYQPGSPLVNSLGSLFQQRSMLFLGASLLTDRTLDLLSRIRTADSTTTHFAILQSSIDEAEQVTRRIFLTGYGIQAIFYPSGEHGSISVILEHLFEEVNPTEFEVFIPKLGTERDFSNRFDWRNEFTAFAGREEELKRLQDFLDNKGSTAKSKRVTWWAVTGPGGMGKSRLIDQFIVNLAPGWQACQFSNHREITQERIDNKVNNITGNVLILADYVQNLSDQFSTWIQANANESSQKQIRVLLLQRESYNTSRRAATDHNGGGAVPPTPPWLQYMVNTFTSIMDFAYREESLDLGFLSETSLKEIMFSYEKSLNPDYAVRKLDDQSSEQLNQRLRELDPDFLRPLFAMFLADAYLRGNDPTEWDQEAILRHFTDREVDRVHDDLKSLFSHNSKSPNSVDYDSLKIILTLATILGGQHLDTQSKLLEPYQNLKNVLCPHNPKSYFYESLAACGLAEKVLDETGLQLIMPSIKPDLLGEHFVNRHFQEAVPDQSSLLPLIKSESKKLINQSRIRDFFVRFSSHYLLSKKWLEELACVKPASYGIMAGLINQAEAGIFPAGLYQMANVLLEADTEDSFLHLLFSGLLYTLTYSRNNLSEITEAVDKLQSQQSSFPNSHVIALALAWGLFNLTVEQQTVEDIRVSVNRLEALHNSFPDSRGIALALARGLFNLTVKQEKVQDTSDTVGRLEVLHNRFPDSQEIALRLAQGLFNLTVRQETAQDRRDTVGRLEVLHNRFPDSQEIAFELAEGLFNMTNELETLEDRSLFVGQLEALYKRYSASLKIAFELARGLFNLTVTQETAQDRRKTVGRLEVLHNRFPDSQEIALAFGKGLASLTVKQETAQDTSEVVDKLQSLHSNFSGSQKIAFAFAKGLVNLTGKQETAQDRRDTVARLEALHSSFPGSQEIALRLAQGLFNLAASQETAQDRGVTVGRLEALHKRFPDSQEIAHIFARGLVNMTNELETLEDRSLFVGQLEALYKRYSASLKIAFELARGLFNLTVTQETAQDRRKTVGRLETLHNSFPDSHDIALAFANGLFNLTVEQETTEDINYTLDRLEPLYMRFPDSWEIALTFANGLVNLTVKQERLEERSHTVDRLEALCMCFPASQAIALAFANGLFNMTNKQETLEDKIYSLNRLEALYIRFPDSQEIAFEFAKELVNLTVKQETLEERSHTVDLLEALHTRFPNFQLIALTFAMGLFNMTIKQETLEEVNHTVDLLEALHNSFPDSQEIAFELAKGLNSLYDKTIDPLMKEKTIRKIQELKRRFPGYDGFDLPKSD